MTTVHGRGLESWAKCLFPSRHRGPPNLRGTLSCSMPSINSRAPCRSRATAGDTARTLVGGQQPLPSGKNTVGRRDTLPCARPGRIRRRPGHRPGQLGLLTIGKQTPARSSSSYWRPRPRGASSGRRSPEAPPVGTARRHALTRSHSGPSSARSGSEFAKSPGPPSTATVFGPDGWAVSGGVWPRCL